MTAIRLLICLSLHLASGPLFAQSQHEGHQDVRVKLEQLLADKDGAGLAIGIVTDRGPIWQAGLGLADIEQNIPVTPATPFQIASVSKIVIGLACGLLVEEFPERISWQTPVKQILPRVPVNNPWDDTHPLRFIHLLEHASGAQEVIIPWIPTFQYPSPEAILTTYLDQIPLIRPPGDYVTYSNFNYIAAAAIIEKISGESFDDYIARKIFAPLNMHHSSFRLADVKPQTLAKRYAAETLLEDPITEGAYRYAAGMISNIEDLSNFLEALLNEGRFQGRQIFTPALIANLEHPQSSIAAKHGLQPLGHGPGSVLRQADNRIYAGHNGITDGFQATMYYDRIFKYGIIILQNNHPLPYSPSLSGIRKTLIEHFFADVHYQKQDSRPIDAKAFVDKFKAWDGFYRIANPRFAKTGFFQRLQNAVFLKVTEKGLHINHVWGDDQLLKPAGSATFKDQDQDQIYASAFLGENSLGTKFFHKLSNDFYEPSSFLGYLIQLIWFVMGPLLLIVGLIYLMIQSLRPAAHPSRLMVSAGSKWATLAALLCFMIMALVLTAINTSYKATSLNLYSATLFGTTLLLPLLCSLALVAITLDLKKSRISLFAPLQLISLGLAMISVLLVCTGWFAVAFW